MRHYRVCFALASQRQSARADCSRNQLVSTTRIRRRRERPLARWRRLQALSNRERQRQREREIPLCALLLLLLLSLSISLLLSLISKLLYIIMLIVIYIQTNIFLASQGWLDVALTSLTQQAWMDMESLVYVRARSHRATDESIIFTYFALARYFATPSNTCKAFWTRKGANVVFLTELGLLA